ncbi:MAG: hypothetical protein AB8G99_18825, partial [Planctomycetaceae bacterium]
MTATLIGFSVAFGHRMRSLPGAVLSVWLAAKTLDEIKQATSIEKKRRCTWDLQWLADEFGYAQFVGCFEECQGGASSHGQDASTSTLPAAWRFQTVLFEPASVILTYCCFYDGC